MEKQRFDLLKAIEKHIALATLLIVWLAIFVCTISHVPFEGMEPHQAVSYVLTVIAMSMFVAAFPTTVVLFGWFTKRKAASLLLGALLFPSIYCIGFLFLSQGNMVFIHVPGTALYLGVLSAVSGLAGYCAAIHDQRYLAIAIVLVGIWVVALMSGIN